MRLYKCVSAEKQLSPKKEDCVTKYELLAVNAPIGLDKDFFIEKIIYWDCSDHLFKVGKTYLTRVNSDARETYREYVS